MPTDTLSGKTLEYWTLSSAFNGRPIPNPPTVSDANKKLRELSFELGPHRKQLRTKISTLRDDIIKHGNKKKASVMQESKVLHLQPKANLG